MNNKVNPSSAEVISDNTLVETGQEPAFGDFPIVREEELDLCQEVLDSFGSEQLLFQKEHSEGRGTETGGKRKKQKKKERKKNCNNLFYISNNCYGLTVSFL